jgi:hypothetical protein
MTTEQVCGEENLIGDYRISWDWHQLVASKMVSEYSGFVT